MNRLQDTSIDGVYAELYQHLKDKGYPIDDDYCFFHAQFGEKFKESDVKILFYGRATNSWDDDPGTNAGILAIEEYRYGAFFPLIRRIAKSILGENYINQIGWSNTCKVAPWAGGNPSEACYDDQYHYNTKIMQWEIETASPDVLVFITGLRNHLRWDWSFQELYPNRRALDVARCPMNDDCSVESYLIDVNGKEVLALVTGRPERKPYDAQEFQFSAIREAIQKFRNTR